MERVVAVPHNAWGEGVLARNLQNTGLKVTKVTLLRLSGSDVELSAYLPACPRQTIIGLARNAHILF
jgi:hypothetical protein